MHGAHDHGRWDGQAQLQLMPPAGRSQAARRRRSSWLLALAMAAHLHHGRARTHARDPAQGKTGGSLPLSATDMPCRACVHAASRPSLRSMHARTGDVLKFFSR